MLRNLTSSDGKPNLDYDAGATIWKIFGNTRTLRRNLGKGHVLIHQANRTVATLLAAWEKAASAFCYWFTNIMRESRYLRGVIDK